LIIATLPSSRFHAYKPSFPTRRSSDLGARQIVGESESRPHVAVLRGLIGCSRGPVFCGIDESERCWIEVDQPIAGFNVRREDVPADTQVEGEAARSPPIVFEEGGMDGVGHVIRGDQEAAGGARQVAE